jgi:predicted DNA-binding transcriptional regulator AlpA
MTPAVYTAEQFAALASVSTWSIYESVKRGDCPVSPVKFGRRLVWPKSAVDRLLGLENKEEETS